MGPNAVAILIGARRVTRSHDTHYPFRQDSDFWYLTGFDHPDAIALLRTDGGPEYALYVEDNGLVMQSRSGYARISVTVNDRRILGPLLSKLPF